MRSSLGVALALIAVAAGGCGAALEEPALYLSPDRSSFDGRTERVILKVRALDAKGNPAGGVVHLEAPVGQFIGGNELILTDGFATATYACSPDEEAACEGTVRLAGTWENLRSSTQVTVVPVLRVTPVVWEVVPTRSLATIFAVASTSDGSAWAVGDNGAVLQLVGREWTTVPSPVSTNLRALAFDERNAPIIVGDDGVVLRWVSGALRRIRFGVKDTFSAVAVSNNGEVQIGSADGVISSVVGDELQARLDLKTPILAMANVGAEVWATGDGVLAHLDTSQWLNLPMPLDARLTVAQPGREGLWLGGSRQGATSVSGVVILGPNPTWRTTALPEAVHAFSEVPHVAERFALTTSHLYRQLGEGQWTAVEVPLPTSALLMTSRAPGDLVLMGPPGISLLRVKN